MSFDGREGTWYTVEQAAVLTHAFQAEAGKDAIIAEFMGKDKLLEILNQPNCEGLRVYLGKKADGSTCLVFLGADANENDQLTLILENGRPCPKWCGVESPLR